MKALPQDENRPGDGKKPFWFFPERPHDVQCEGREPHERMKSDPLADRFPTERQIGYFLFAVALAGYLASMSWAPFPGLPTQSLLLHLDREVDVGVLDLSWGWLVRLFARLPGLSVAGWAGLFSALCGAACVALVGRLMMRTGYLIRNEPGPTTFTREAQARRISGCVAGLYLACSIPFWVASTRSLPGTFHLLLLLVSAWLFSQYQHWGRARHLFLLGLFCGFGITEFATFIVFLPVVAFLISHEMFRWRALYSWKPQVAIWGGLALGLSWYPLHAAILFRQGAASGAFASFGQAWGTILQEQLLLITQIRFSAGFPVIMFFALAPWLVLFAMSSRSPWFYEGGQVAVRLIFVGGLLGVLYNASFGPWNLLGMGYLMVTPYLLMAVCMGYMAGEFWILGEPQALVDHAFAKRLARRARRVSSLFALFLPIAILGSAACNWREVDGRHGGIVAAAAHEILARLEGRDVVFSAGPLDDSLRLAIRLKRAPVHLIGAQRMASAKQLRRLADAFADPALKMPLLQGDFGVFLENWLLSAAGPARTAILDVPEVFREFGYLVPDGYLYRLETSPDRMDLPATIAAQAPFWAQMERMAKYPVPEKNLVRPYQDLLRLLASKVANNLGVLQAERGDESGALDTFRTARRMYPDNLSVLLNLLELGRRRSLPENEELEAEWSARQDKLGGDRWALALRYGYVWRASEWIRRGWAWVLSGAPTSVEACRRNPAATDDKSDETAQLLDHAYLLWGTPFRDENSFRALLMQNDKDTDALMEMGRLALRRNDAEAAEAYFTEALVMGLPEERVWFDRAMATYVRGDPDAALAALEDLTRQTSGDARVWMAIALLTETHDPRNLQALKTLKNHAPGGIGLPLSLAWMYMARQQWGQAQAELERAVQVDPDNLQAWEMLATVAQEQGNRNLMASSLKALLSRNPDHFIQHQQAGLECYQKSDLAGAEAAFRKGLQLRRDPTLLNNLASVVMERGGDLEEALALINEALRRQPGQAGLFVTRGEIYLKMGRFDEARRDLQVALTKQGRRNSLLLKLAQSYAGAGERALALKVGKALARQPDQLTAEEKRQVRELLLRLR